MDLETDPPVVLLVAGNPRRVLQAVPVHGRVDYAAEAVGPLQGICEPGVEVEDFDGCGCFVADEHTTKSLQHSDFTVEITVKYLERNHHVLFSHGSSKSHKSL